MKSEEEYSNSTSAWIEEAKRNALNDERTIYIWEDIDDDTSFIFNRAVEKIMETDQENETDILPITIKINSYGGSVFSLMSILSKIEEAKSLGYEIITIGYGMAMSAGLWILMSGTKRKAQRYCRMLLHQVQSFSMGSTSVELTKREYQNLLEMWDEMREYTKEHTCVTEEMLDNITNNNLDYYFFAEKGLELGIIDEVI
jgi:ATP-dependent protease ClpP protease subunit